MLNYINPLRQRIAGVTHKTFHSNIYAHDIGYNIYLPVDYETSGDRYPVVYHIHGWMGNESTEVQPMEPVFRARNAITVFVNHAHVTGNVWELPNAPMDIDELIPHIDSTYRTIATREGRSITGFSMGGGVAASMAFKYPELFSSVVAYAGTYHHYFSSDYSTVGEPVGLAEEIYARMMSEKKFFEGSIIQRLLENADKIRNSTKINLHVGTEDILYCDNEILHLHLNALHIPHEYRKYEGADHNLSLIL